MSTQELEDKLIAYCREGRFREAQADLYSDDASSIEPEGSPWPSCYGREALNAKIDQWENAVEEVHSIEISDPLIAGNFIALRMAFDVTRNDIGRNQGDEICVFETKDGKIVKEEFFYTM